MIMYELNLLDERLQHTRNRLVRLAIELEALFPHSFASRQNVFQFTMKSSKHEETVIHAKELECVHAQGNVHTYYGRNHGHQYSITHSGHLKLAYDMLHPLGFELAHESWLVNTLMVKKFIMDDKQHFFLEMKSGTIVPVSHKQLATLRKMLPGTELFSKPN